MISKVLSMLWESCQINPCVFLEVVVCHLFGLFLFCISVLYLLKIISSWCRFKQMLLVFLWKRWRFLRWIYFLPYFLCSQACWIARQKGNFSLIQWFWNSRWELNVGTNDIELKIYCLFPMAALYKKHKLVSGSHLLYS
jgi:hypothetical protein